MKRKLLLTLFICVLGVCLFGFKNNKVLYSQADPSISGTYSGSSPCGNFVKQLLDIPSHIECEYITWTIRFYEDPMTHKPLSFELGYAVKSFANGGTQTYAETKGKWTITTGAKTNVAAIVYELNPDNTQHSISFIKIDDNILHLLYSDKNLMIGDAGWSYTLNKVSN